MERTEHGSVHDLEFRDRLAQLDPESLRSLSAERRDYVRFAISAMNWWIDSGRAGEPAPATPVLRDDAADRDRIVVAYVEATPGADLGAALWAIDAQTHHLESC